MWTFFIKLIIRYRVVTLIAIVALTAFAAYHARKVELSYEFHQMLPSSDPYSQTYEEFKEVYGQDGSVLFVVVKDPNIYELGPFNAWYDLTQHLKGIDGVAEVLSIANVLELYKNDSTHRFAFRPVMDSKPQKQEELDSLIEKVFSLPFYEGLLYNNETQTTMMAVTLEDTLNFKKERNQKILDIEQIVEEFGQKHDLELHFSGMPYIRSIMQIKIQKELLLFVILAMSIASIALFIFFRSVKATVFPMLIVLMAVIWVLGIISLLGYKITLLTGILPSLMIIIGVENSIFLLNKYHQEYRTHGNKIMALSRMIQRVGAATFLTNLTTAIGFSAFIIAGNDLLVEFGIIAAINIMVVFVLTTTLIPIFFSFLAPPKTRHIKHLDNKFTTTVVGWILKTVIERRRWVYAIATFLAVVGIIGMTQLRTTGSYLDDVPRDEKLYKDLLFMEEEFKGMMPFEISIDTKKPRGVMRYQTIRKIAELQDTLATYPELSRSMSVAEVVKYAHQAYYPSGRASNYNVPSKRMMQSMLTWMPDMQGDQSSILSSFVDSSFSRTRISARMKDLGMHEVERIRTDLEPKIHSIFNPGLALQLDLTKALDTIPGLKKRDKKAAVKALDTLFHYSGNKDLDTDSLIEIANASLPSSLLPMLEENSWKVPMTEEYEVDITGISVVMLRGNAYLVKNLRTSLLLAIIAIGILMFLLFNSVQMVGVSLIPNLLPQLLTAALMGFLAIPIKPSTVLIFSIALGISVDNAIHFLSRYRIQLKLTNLNRRESVMSALKETSYGMIYSSIVLFLGFGIFVMSTFGGTKAMGYLVSFTLLMAVASNLILLPSILLSLDQRTTAKLFRDPMIILLDEEEDIELDDLEIEGQDTRGSA